MTYFPFYSPSPLYWNLHYPLQLLACVGISFGANGLSRLSCLIFAIFQMVNVLKSLSDYNNHEYLYSLISLFFSCLEIHPVLNIQTAPRYSSLGILLITLGTGYMMLWNVVYGIAGSIAVIGMPCIFCGVALLLDTQDRNNLPKISVWNFWVLQIFLGSVYFYAGIAKCDDDWLSGFTLRELYQSWTGPTALQPLLDDLIEREWPIIWIAYSGLLLDLFAPFGLVAPHHSIRVTFALMTIGFHLMNHFTFIIETFPWVMMSSLVIYFDSDWIPSLSQTLQYIQSLCKVPSPFLKFASLNITKWISFLLLILILIPNLLIPLPCALETLLETQTVNYSSRCQFFSWRMMTRSSKLFTFIIHLKNEKSQQIDSISLSQFHLSENEISSISIHEDYLFQTIQQIKSMALPSPGLTGEYVPPRITADIWLQINGPPIQRYVVPSIDLSQGPASSPLPSSLNDSLIWKSLHSLFHSELSSYPWVEDRILEYRTPFWKEVFRNITKSERLKSRKRLGSSLSSLSKDSSRVMFFADRSGPERILTVYAKEISLLAVLSGRLFLQGYGFVPAEQCLLVQGHVHVTVPPLHSATSVTGDTSSEAGVATSLWMIRDLNNSVVVLSKYSQKKFSPLLVHRNQPCSLLSLATTFPSSSSLGMKSQTNPQTIKQKRKEL